MKRSFTALIAGLIAGAIGFYAALAGLIAAAGLDGDGLMPPVSTAGAVGLGLAAVSGAHRIGLKSGLALALAGAALGAAIGALLGQMVDSFEWTIAAAAVVISITAFWLGSESVVTSGKSHAEPSSV